MPTPKTLWIALWKVALAAGFGGLGALGLGLMLGALWYSTGILWGIVVFLVGLLGVLLAVGTAMTAMDGPRVRPS